VLKYYHIAAIRKRRLIDVPFEVMMVVAATSFFAVAGSGLSSNT
jgi:hypothetical protein